MRLLQMPFNNLSRCSGLCLFITVYLSLFVIAGIILFGPLLRNSRNGVLILPGNYQFSEDKLNSRSSEYFSSLGAFTQRPNNAQKSSKRPIEEEEEEKEGINLLLRSTFDFYWPHSYSTLVNCSTLQEISDTEFVAAGWTKIVYKGTFRGKQVAVKTARYNGRDVQECQKDIGSSKTCFERVDAKILKEVVLLTDLAHENVVKILGFCIPELDGTATLVTELGEPIDTVRLLQISWEDRLRLVLGIAQILNHFAHSPLGPLSMNDFRREQFVIVNGVLKVTDLDDVGIGDPECINDDICKNITNFALNRNTTKEDGDTRFPSCINFRCVGHNSRTNVWHAGQHFVKLLLPIGAPENLKPHIQNLIDTYEFKKKVSLYEEVPYILQKTQQIVDLYKSGEYMNTSEGLDELGTIFMKYQWSQGVAWWGVGFKRISNADLPGMFDYHCRNSISAVSCVISVFNAEEAAELCAKDPDCKAVVLSKEQTWTGRTIAIFKNGFNSPSVEEGFILIHKQGL
ncbi:Uncharacterized protein GBIM_08049 [Gryllus bimaculatus]|nr:Uncharacterized protein GBIM_08049 [Gryllus bimaculatus]